MLLRSFGVARRNAPRAGLIGPETTSMSTSLTSEVTVLLLLLHLEKVDR